MPFSSFPWGTGPHQPRSRNSPTDRKAIQQAGAYGVAEKSRTPYGVRRGMDASGQLRESSLVPSAVEQSAELSFRREYKTEVNLVGLYADHCSYQNYQPQIRFPGSP